ncbi:MAG: Peptide chain release factor subunit 1 [Candidatus Syntrophoarchaeum sp. GoM_oil]|nr:MAG: Peptide chain release factor subunit 1 [Candidatus Syntrophoarchaeum sp. GoM_oil]
MFGKSSKINELEATVDKLKGKIETLQSERDSLSRQLSKEEERGRRAKKDLQGVEVSLKEAKQRVVTLEDKLEQLGEVESEDITFKNTITLTDQGSIELLSKIRSIRSEKQDLLTIYLRSGEKIADLERPGEIPVLGDDLEYLIPKIESDTGLFIFHDTNRILLNTLIVTPQFPLDASGWMLADTFNTVPFEELLRKDRIFCIILSHADETFIGVSNRDDFLDDTVIRSSVKEKHTKGGWSQKRFARLREEDIKNHVKKVSDALSEIIGKWGDSIEFIIVGGDYNLIKEPLSSFSKIPIVVRGIDANVGKEREDLEDIRVKALSLRWYVLG